MNKLRQCINMLFTRKSKSLIFTFGSLLLPENIKRFESKLLKSVYLRGYKISIIKSPITKTNYHYLLLEKTNDNNDIVSGYLLETSRLKEIDKWEGDTYKRITEKCVDRNLNEINCELYIKNI